MSINISEKPEMNVVNVGDEITTDQLAGITNAASPTSANPFATMADVGGGGGSQSVFREAVLFNTSDESTITINSQDFANGFTRDVVGEALAVNGDGFGVTQKFIIFLRAPTQGINAPTVSVKLYDGDTAAVRAGTVTQVGEFTGDNIDFKYSVYPGYQTRYEWSFELTPTGMAGPVRIFPDISFSTSDSEVGSWEFTFVWEASIPA